MNFDKLFELAKAENITELEVYSQENKGMNIRVFDSLVDKYVINDTTSVAIRGIYNGKMGYVSIENLSDDMIDFVINKLKSNAGSLTITEESFIFSGSDEYKTVNKQETDFKQHSTEDKINLLKELEQKILTFDHRITNVSHCSYSQRYLKTTIRNSKGLNLTKEKELGTLFASCVAKENGDVKSGYDHVLFAKLGDVSIDEIAKNAANKAVSALQATPVTSKKYPVILNNEVVADLLSAFEPMFSGESVLRGTTKLKDKLNEKIVNEKITLVDDPFFSLSVSQEPFDDEGVACYTKEVISNGVLKTFLHNLKSANALKVKPTGNGYKAGVNSTVGVNSCNFFLKNGDTSFDTMIESINEGLLITSVSGLHAGVNSVTGDFNLQSSGFLIENGKISRPVTLIVIGGNFIEMLNDVESIGNDFKFSVTGSPSLKIRSLVVSGN